MSRGAERDSSDAAAGADRRVSDGDSLGCSGDQHGVAVVSESIERRATGT